MFVACCPLVDAGWSRALAGERGCDLDRIADLKSLAEIGGSKGFAASELGGWGLVGADAERRGYILERAQLERERGIRGVDFGLAPGRLIGPGLGGGRPARGAGCWCLAGAARISSIYR